MAVNYPREDTCPKCGKHTGMVMNGQGEMFAGCLCDDCLAQQAEQATDALIEKVRERLAAKGEDASDEKALEAACWLVCLQLGDAIRDSWSRKDYARAFSSGEMLGPIKTREDIKEQYAETIDDWDWLDAALNQHFGL